MYLLGFNFPQAAPGIPWDELAVGSDFKRSWDTKYLGQTSDPKTCKRPGTGSKHPGTQCFGTELLSQAYWDTGSSQPLSGPDTCPKSTGMQARSNVSWDRTLVPSLLG